MQAIYDKYDTSALYHYSVEEAARKQEKLIEEYELLTRALPHGYKTKAIQAGEMLEIRVSPWFKNRKDYTRATKYQASSEVQKKLNQRNAQAKFIRLVSTNFTAGDTFFTGGWTFKEMPKDLKDAKRLFENYIKRVKTSLKKETSKKLKYIYVIESVPGKVELGEPAIKYHVHVIFGVDGYQLDMDMILDKWKGGAYPKIGRLYDKEGAGFTGISSYFSKQMTEMEESEGSRIRRWGSSQGLKDRSRKASVNYSKFSKKQVLAMYKAPATLKKEFEKAYPDYTYNEEYPCTPMYNEVVGGFYLLCRMYRKRE